MGTLPPTPTHIPRHPNGQPPAPASPSSNCTVPSVQKQGPKASKRPAGSAAMSPDHAGGPCSSTQGWAASRGLAGLAGLAMEQGCLLAAGPEAQDQQAERHNRLPLAPPNAPTLSPARCQEAPEHGCAGRQEALAPLPPDWRSASRLLVPQDTHQRRVDEVPKGVQMQVQQLQCHEGPLVGGACSAGSAGRRRRPLQARPRQRGAQEGEGSPLNARTGRQERQRRCQGRRGLRRAAGVQRPWGRRRGSESRWLARVG